MLPLLHQLKKLQKKCAMQSVRLFVYKKHDAYFLAFCKVSGFLNIYILFDFLYIKRARFLSLMRVIVIYIYTQFVLRDVFI